MWWTVSKFRTKVSKNKAKHYYNVHSNDFGEVYPLDFIVTANKDNDLLSMKFRAYTDEDFMDDLQIRIINEFYAMTRISKGDILKEKSFLVHFKS